ncbi:MAG: type IV conjugative transfer system lipoprotein TraV [Rhodocyclaceae bacterium]|nr:type IV conjugative transfer system lipoprotein TraV [Rhodocyclaceae bacterium]
MIKNLTGFAALLSLAGCSSMSGLDASTSFSCKAPPGVTCQSISGVQSNYQQGNLPFQNQQREGAKEKEGDKPSYGAAGSGSGPQKLSPREMVAASTGTPVRQPPLVLRVWVAPYEDEQGDLHDQSYFYTMVHSGRWMIEANRTALSNQFRPVHPLSRGTVPRTEVPATPAAEKPKLLQKGDYEGLIQKPPGGY